MKVLANLFKARSALSCCGIVSTVASRLGRILRYVQSGLGQSYLYWMTGGLIVLFVWVAINFS